MTAADRLRAIIEMEPTKFNLKWDRDFQYTDGVPAEIIVASGNEIDEHERRVTVNKSDYDRMMRIAELVPELMSYIGVCRHTAKNASVVCSKCAINAKASALVEELSE